ncbi:hypothetical protein BDC45DRAFT_224336 [Circinella umbellata]|nr:hypothetical protein BDC45DRAFT_224336 [Circinella umbellata]
MDTIDLDPDTLLSFKGPFDPPYFRRVLYNNYSDLKKGPKIQLIKPIELLQELVEENNIPEDILSSSTINLSCIPGIINDIDSRNEEVNILVPDIIDEIRSQLATIELSNNDSACILLTWISYYEFTQQTCNAFIKAMCKDLWERVLYIDTSQRKAHISRLLDSVDIRNLGYETFCKIQILFLRAVPIK